MRALLRENEVMCPLCKSSPEARVHIITECPVMQDIRMPLMREIRNYIPTPSLTYKAIFSNKELITHLVLDPSHTKIKKLYQMTKMDYYNIEKVSRMMCYRMHYRRAQIMGY